MPTVFTHPAPVLAAGFALGQNVISLRLLLAGLICSILPDLDVVTFKLGIAYADTWGHRGASHSLLFALGAGVFGFLAAPLLKSKRKTAFLLLSGAVAMHILLDAMTSGGLGVAFFWPWDETRYFLPWRPIRVSPLALDKFFSTRGAQVILSELKWVWLPFFSLALVIFLTRKACRR